MYRKSASSRTCSTLMTRLGFSGFSAQRASGSTRRKSGWLPARNQRQASHASQGRLPVPSHRKSCEALGELELACAARPRRRGARAAGARGGVRANRGSAGSRGASEVGERTLERLADLGHRRGGIDHPHALRLGARALEVRRAHALEKSRPSRSKRSSVFPCSRRLETSNEQSKTSVRSGTRPGCAAAARRSIRSPGTPFPSPWYAAVASVKRSQTTHVPASSAGRSRARRGRREPRKGAASRPRASSGS